MLERIFKIFYLFNLGGRAHNYFVSRGQFHQRSMCSFYARRSQKRKFQLSCQCLFTLLGSAPVKAAPREIDTRGRFHQHFTRSIYAHRSRKCKKTVFSPHLGSALLKAAQKMLMKSTPGFFH
jgi:hypothetical protein